MSDYADLRSAIKPYEHPVISVSLFQLVSSLGLFVAACALMYGSLRFSYLLTLFLAVPTGALLVRVFIIQHDCGYGSFFRSRWANDLVGAACSIFTLTPYANWRRQHSHHHASWNNLDKRSWGAADIYSSCLTVSDYKRLTRWQRFLYRFPRHPIISHVVLPPLVFAVLYRFAFDTPKSWIKERQSVYRLNAALMIIICAFGMTIGFGPVLLVYLPVMLVTSIIGVWLFAVQHRYEESQWARNEQWSFTSAALEGASFLKLPRVLQWFTGNIGFHNIHHLAPRVPNYSLESCYRSAQVLQERPPLTLRSAFASIRLALWDEDQRRLVRFRDISEPAAQLS